MAILDSIWRLLVLAGNGANTGLGQGFHLPVLDGNVGSGQHGGKCVSQAWGLRMTRAETQLAGYYALYEPALARLGKALRAKLRERLPGLTEVVYLYENQNSLVISYSATEKGYEALCSLALNPTGAKLFFAQGPLLAKADRNKLLQGSGKVVRFVELGTVADLGRPDIEALMTAAVLQAKLQLDASATGAIIIKADGQRQRASRARAVAAKKPVRRKPKPKR